MLTQFRHILVEKNLFLSSTAVSHSINVGFSLHISGETFLDALEPYDQVMADRGFDIADLLAPKCVTLNIPPFTKGKTQLDQAEVQRHRKVSSLRIHVERAIERIKIFRVLQGVFPVSRIKQLDDIMTIICGVTNLLPPLVQDKD